MSKRTVTFCAAIGFVAASASVAQAQEPARTRPSDHVALTGCLDAGDEPDTFVLRNAVTTPAATSDTGSTRRSTAEWQLQGATSRLKLRDHIGHRVQMTGSMLKATATEDDVIARLFAARAGLREGVIGTSGRSEGGQPSVERQRVRIEALRHIANTCQ